jgi:hypothetical protein
VSRAMVIDHAQRESFDDSMALSIGSTSCTWCWLKLRLDFGVNDLCGMWVSSGGAAGAIHRIHIKVLETHVMKESLATGSRV